jgi:hypothetical protein
MKKSIFFLPLILCCLGFSFVGLVLAKETKIALDVTNRSSNIITLDKMTLNNVQFGSNFPFRLTTNSGRTVWITLAKPGDTITISGSLELTGNILPNARQQSKFTATIKLENGSQWTSGLLKVKVQHMPVPDDMGFESYDISFE